MASSAYQVPPPVGKIPFPWERPKAPPMQSNLSKEDRANFYSSQVAANNRHKAGVEFNIHAKLFCGISPILMASHTAESYVAAPCVAPYTGHLAAVLWANTALKPDPYVPDPTKEQITRFILIGQTALLKLEAVGVNFTDYISQKSVEEMKGRFQLRR